MSAHTPGPWVVDGVRVIAMNGSLVIADTRGFELYSRGEAAANLATIAAAPDLLEVARELLEDHRRVDAHHEDMCALCRRAAAAIAKAEGTP